MGDTRCVVHMSEVAALARRRDVAEAMLDAAQPGVRRAQSHAPHLTGAGAGSIRPEPVLDGPTMTIRVSWDREHYYMGFHERGTSTLPARPFLVSAFE